MNNEDIQELEGPYKYHLYIGFALKDETTVLDLFKSLQEKGLSCCLRSRSTNDSIQESIQDGVNTSQKCLLVITSNYVKDKWYQIETQAVIEKAERFCRDVVIILRGEHLELIPGELRKFKTHLFQQLKDEKKFSRFVDSITQEPNVHLAVLPKQNIGYGSACSYFYGFLRLVLPDFRRRLIEETLKNNPDLVSKTVQKMLIIMPESCMCAVELQLRDRIEFTGKFVVKVGHRAGNQKRDYKSSLYKLIDHEEKKEYYFVGELATPLLTMYEMYHFRLCGLTQDQLYAERDGFYFALKSILSHPDNAECNDQFKLLYWSDPETKKKNQLDIYNFLRPKLRKEIELQQQNPSQFGANHSVRLLSKNPLSLNSFETLKIDGSNPARIYDEINRYPMDRHPRGMCLIVNIANFEKSQRHLQPRRGAERDAELLTNLFKDLHFEVQVHNDVSAQTLELLFLTMHSVDHSNYDAFVCCILTHGKLGVIYTSDGQPVEILNLVGYFTDKNCPSLNGKPKMFFIQACQRGDTEQENGAAGNSLRSNGSRDHVAPLSSQNTDSDSAPSMADRETVEQGIPEAIPEAIPGIQERTCINVRDVESAIEADASSDPTVSVLEKILPTTIKHGSRDHVAPPSSQNTDSDSSSSRADGETVEEGIPEAISGIEKRTCSITMKDVVPTIQIDARSVPTVSVLEESSPTTIKHKAVLVPGSPDFLMSYSTLPGSISYRDTHNGSLYIQSLCDCLRMGMEIDRALKMVSFKVRENLRLRGETDGVQERFQLPFHLTSGMDQLIYL